MKDIDKFDLKPVCRAV